MSSLKLSNKLMWSVVVIGLFLTACSKEDPSKADQSKRPPMNVAVTKVTRSDSVLTSKLSGRVSAIKNAEIRARVSGIVENINFEQGSKVKEGDVLFEIDPATYQASYDAAIAAYNQALAASSQSNSLASRYKKLINSKAISQQEYENAMANVKQAQASVTAAKANVEQAKINLSYTKVSSPIDGTIGEALVTEGALVSAAQATPLAQVQDLSRVYVDFSQSTAELSNLRNIASSGKIKFASKEELPVKLVLEDGSIYKETGKLLFSGVFVDPSTGMVKLRAIFPNPDTTLLPGMYVQILIDHGVTNNMVVVPYQAVMRRDDGSSMVFVVEQDKVAIKPVKLGRQIDQNIIIESGLNGGESLIVEGISKIGPGMPVKGIPWSKEQKGVMGTKPNMQNAQSKDASARQKENTKANPKPQTNKNGMKNG